MRNLKVKSKNIHLLFLPRDLLFFMFFVIYKNINVSKRCRKAFVFFAPIAVLCVLSDTENISQEKQSISQKNAKWNFGNPLRPLGSLSLLREEKKSGDFVGEVIEVNKTITLNKQKKLPISSF